MHRHTTALFLALVYRRQLWQQSCASEVPVPSADWQDILEPSKEQQVLRCTAPVHTDVAAQFAAAQTAHLDDVSDLQGPKLQCPVQPRFRHVQYDVE